MPASFSDLWKATEETLRAESIPIKTADQSTGVVVSEEFPVQKKEYRQWAKTSRFAPSGFCTLHLKINSKGDEESELVIAPEFKRKRRGVIWKRGGRDKSRSVFENLFAARVHAVLISEKYPNLSRVVVGCGFKLNDATNRYEVIDVKRGSLGEEQGLKSNDVITEIDGVNVTGANFFKVLSSVSKSETRNFTILRKKETMKLNIDIFYLGPDLPWFGLKAERASDLSGFKITEVVGGGPADKAGLKTGDILTEEEGLALSCWKNYYKGVTSTKPDVVRNFTVLRNGISTPISITPISADQFLKKLPLSLSENPNK